MIIFAPSNFKFLIYMTDKEKIKKIEEILAEGNGVMNVLDNIKKDIKDKLNFDVDLNTDGTIKKYWYKNRPTRKPRTKKEKTPVVEVKAEEIEVEKPKTKGKKK